MPVCISLRIRWIATIGDVVEQQRMPHSVKRKAYSLVEAPPRDNAQPSQYSALCQARVIIAAMATHCCPVSHPAKDAMGVSVALSILVDSLIRLFQWYEGERHPVEVSSRSICRTVPRG
jgi:hypothetical protein